MIDIKKTPEDFDVTATRLARLVSLIVAVAFAGSSPLHAAQPLARATPESQGVPSRAVVEWVRAMDAQGGFNGFVLLRHGRTIAEGWWSPCETNGLHMLYSLSKSFTSTAIGMLADEGKLDLDERIADLFPDKMPPDPSRNLLEMRVRDLLSMATGHETDSAPSLTHSADGDWIKAFLAHPVPRRPGTWFRYDSGATYMLSAIVRAKSGERPSEYLAHRLFEPLGISGARWNRSPEGEDLGGWGLNMTTRAIARFGQFWLQRGEWGGRQLLSRDYVALASAKQISNASGPRRFEGDTVTGDWQAGYGFQFWRCTHGCYRAAGAYGQLAVVMPDQDAVLAVNSNSPMRKTLERLWEILLPAMGDAPLPEAPEEAQALERLTASLVRPTMRGDAVGCVAGGSFSDGNGASFSLSSADGGWTLAVTNAEWRCSIPVGFGEWRRGAVDFKAKFEMLRCLPGRQAVAACGAWTVPDTFEAELFFVETPHAAKVTIRFDGCTATLNVCSGAKNVEVKCVGSQSTQACSSGQAGS